MGGEFCVNQLCSLSFYSQKIDRKIEKNKTENIKLRVSTKQFLSYSEKSIQALCTFELIFSKLKWNFLYNRMIDKN